MVAWTPRLPRVLHLPHSLRFPSTLFSLVSEQTGVRSENAHRPETQALWIVPCPTTPGDRAMGGEAAEAAAHPPEDPQPSHSWKPRSTSTGVRMKQDGDSGPLRTVIMMEAGPGFKSFRTLFLEL